MTYSVVIPIERWMETKYRVYNTRGICTGQRSSIQEWLTQRYIEIDFDTISERKETFDLLGKSDYYDRPIAFRFNFKDRRTAILFKLTWG